MPNFSSNNSLAHLHQTPNIVSVLRALVQTISDTLTVASSVVITKGGSGPTRFYLHNTNNATTGLPTTKQSAQAVGGSPTAQTVNKNMTTTIGTSQATYTNSSSFTGYNYWGRWVSDTLGTSITAQTWTFSFAYDDAFGNISNGVRICIYVWNPGTQTKRGDVCDTVVSQAFAGTETGYKLTVAGSAVTIGGGDVLCVEFMCNCFSNTVPLHFYFDGTTVVATNNTTTSSCAAYIETPQTITLGVRALTATLSHSVIFSNAEVVLRNKNRIHSPTLTMSDGYVDLRQKNRAPSTSDIVTFTDLYSILRQRNKTFSDLISFVDSHVKMTTRIRALSHSLTQADSYTRIKNVIRILSNALTFSDSNSELRNKIRQISSDSISFIGSLVREITGRIRTFADAISFVDTPYSTMTSRIRGLSSDILSFVDSLTTSLGLSRTIGDVNTGSDPNDTTITFTTTTGTFVEKDNSIADSISFVSSIPTTVRNKIRALAAGTLNLTMISTTVRNKFRFFFSTDSVISFSDSIYATTRGLIRAIQDYITMHDTLDDSGTLRGRALSHIITMTGTLTRLTTRNRPLSHSLTMSSVVGGFRNKFQIIGSAVDTLISFTSAHKAFHNRAKTTTDNLTINHSLDRLTNRLRPFVNSLAVTASIIGSKLLSRTSSDSMTLSSTTAMIRGLWRTLANEAMTLTDSSYIKLTGRIRALTHPLTLVSNHNRIKSGIRAVGQTIALVSTYTMTRLRIRALSSDSISFTSSVSRLRMRVRTFTDSTTLTNVPTRMKNVLRSVSHVLPIISSLVNNVISPGPRNLWIRLITFRKG